jgi:hypothetical protein
LPQRVQRSAVITAGCRGQAAGPLRGTAARGATGAAGAAKRTVTPGSSLVAGVPVDTAATGTGADGRC